MYIGFGDWFFGTLRRNGSKRHGTDLLPPGYLLLFKIGNLNAFSINKGMSK